MARIQPVTIGNVTCGPGQPLVWIAGPCVIESHDLTLWIAERLAEMAERLDVPLIFKASFDKANRTSGKSFRGPGLDDGLKTLDAVKHRTLVIRGDAAGDRLALRLRAGDPQTLQVDFGDDGSPDFQVQRRRFVDAGLLTKLGRGAGRTDSWYPALPPSCTPSSTRLSADLVAQRIESPDAPYQRLVFPSLLVRRRTTAAPARRRNG